MGDALIEEPDNQRRDDAPRKDGHVQAHIPKTKARSEPSADTRTHDRRKKEEEQPNEPIPHVEGYRRMRRAA